ncbi:DUF92 domain-containing protein [Bacillus sp. V3B]|uniref:DUF92 domain-containing protein n=1 Tax=Bacillus sp. V3B TaxID=2804915 RepID=UPI00210EA0BB|nr:DUF92 domain-containing protein [Bacillus sp. V3B]MCQ6273698.1 DUF92 domain-containing protein [Bacillus sp. V3B]
MSNVVVILFFITATVTLGYYFKLLTISGAITAFVVGFLVVLGLGMEGLMILGLFFTSSSLWSKIKSAKKRKAEELLVKGSQRDWQQVLANGGLAAVASALYYLTGDSVWLIGFCICLAAANSDTWASEIGSMSKGRPVNVKTFKRSERGTSGAISLLGTFAAGVGSFLIAIASFFLFDLTIIEFYFILIFGFLGNLVDTILGAFVQASYQCLNCGIITEKQTHCGMKTKLIKGFRLLNNDTVNFLSVFFALVMGMLMMN